VARTLKRDRAALRLWNLLLLRGGVAAVVVMTLGDAELAVGLRDYDRPI